MQRQNYGYQVSLQQLDVYMSQMIRSKVTLSMTDNILFENVPEF